MATYPTIAAGQRITAALLQSMLPMTAYKAAATDRASTTTMADDPDLTFTLEASAVYIVEFHLYLGSGSTGLPKTQWTVPSGATGLKGVHGSASTATSDDGISMRTGSHGFTTAVTYGYRSTGPTNLNHATEVGTVITSSAGTCAIQWAQSVSNATAVRMGLGSWARAQRIA